MSKIFVPQTPGKKQGDRWVQKYDLSAASKYGELIHVMPPGLVRSEDWKGMKTRMIKLLSEFEPTDYILAVGDPICISMAVYYAANSHRSGKMVNILRYNREANQYKPITVRF